MFISFSSWSPRQLAGAGWWRLGIGCAFAMHACPDGSSVYLHQLQVRGPMQHAVHWVETQHE